MQTITPTAWHRWMMRLAAPASPNRSRADHGVRREEPVELPFRVTAYTATAVGKSPRKLPVRQYELEVPYLSIGGQAMTGAARLFMPRDAHGPMPLIAVMHYELGLDGAAEYLAEGWAVMTPREALNPFADGVNFNLALVQSGRQLPFIDPQRIALAGGSAGGYVTLMVASQTFPIAAAAALAPLVSMPYNVEFFARNMALARCGAKDEEGDDASCAPIFCAVAEAITGFAAFLGPLAESWRAWLANSPVGLMGLVTCPVLATFSTADTLVPINQVSERFAIRPARGTFPDGLEFARRALVAAPSARKTFMQSVAGRARLFPFKVPANLPSLAVAGASPPPATYAIPCLFSRRQPLSVVILDEGAPDPRLGHFRYCFNYSVVPFLKHWLRRRTPLAPEQLTLRKLELLMRRFRGEDSEAGTECREPGERPALPVRRNAAAREKMDVIVGLRAYSESGAAHRKRLATLYRELPAVLHALDVGAARFDEDVSGGLAWHQAALQSRAQRCQGSVKVFRCGGKAAVQPLALSEGNFARRSWASMPAKAGEAG